MTETRSSVVHMRRWWQHQLGALLGVGHEHPLFRRHQQKADVFTENLNKLDSQEYGNVCCCLTKRYWVRQSFFGILRYNPPVISQA